MFFAAFPIFANESAGEEDEFAHKGGQSQLSFFAFGAQPVVAGFQVWVGAGGGDRRPVKGARPPWMRRRPRLSPEPALKGTTPARAAAFAAGRSPGSGRQAAMVAAAASPTPLIETRISKRLFRTGSRSISAAMATSSSAAIFWQAAA